MRRRAILPLAIICMIGVVVSITVFATRAQARRAALSAAPYLMMWPRSGHAELTRESATGDRPSAVIYGSVGPTGGNR